MKKNLLTNLCSLRNSGLTKMFTGMALLLFVVTGVQAQTTHVVTQATVETIFNGDGYTLGDAVNAGDILDFQDTIDIEHSLVINKQVNIISSTHDAVIMLHTVAGSLMGENPGNCFVINAAGSGSTVRDIFIFNTETWLYNTSNVTFHGVTMHVESARVGSGVGHVSVRYCDHVTFDSCTVYTKDNGGNSCVVLTYCSFCTIQNCTVLSEGSVGNSINMANGFNIYDKPSGYTASTEYNTLKNCNFSVINPSNPGIGSVQLGGMYGLFEGNTLSGCNVAQANTAGAGHVATSLENGFVIRNNTISGQMTTPRYSTVEGNTIGGVLTLVQRNQVTGNTVHSTVRFMADSITFTGNQVFGKLTSSSKAGTITGNAIISNETYAVTLSSTAPNANNTVTDNVLIAAELKGDAAVESKSASNTVSDNNSQATAGSLTWSYDAAANALVIDGTGAMDDYELTDGVSNAPWAFLTAQVERIIIGEEVTVIGTNAFAGFTGVNTVIANGTTPPTLGSGAFDSNAPIYLIHVPLGAATAYQTAWDDYAGLIAEYRSCGTAGHESDVKALYDAATKTLTIAGHGAMADVAALLQRHYDIDDATATRDAQAWVDTLVAHQLLLNK